VSSDLIVDVPEERVQREAPTVLEGVHALADLVAVGAGDLPEIAQFTPDDIGRMRAELERMADHRMMTAGDVAKFLGIAGSNVYGTLRTRDGRWKVPPVQETKAGLLWRALDIEHWEETRPKRRRRTSETD
jgi:predicted DNA-binding transcriptional regulator AlpA